VNIWSYLRVAPILIPFVVGVYKYRSIRSLKYLFFFVLYGVANEMASKVLKEFGLRNTMPQGHLYALVSFTLLCLFYRSVFKGYISEKWFNGVIVLNIVYSITNLLFFQSIYDYPSVSISIMAIVVVAFTIIYFYKTMLEAEVRSLSKEPLVWINTAMLIYYTGNLFYFILFNLFLDYSHEFLKSIGIYWFMLNTLFYILIAVGFYLNNDGERNRSIRKVKSK
jgi:hypothetical protein